MTYLIDSPSLSYGQRISEKKCIYSNKFSKK
uniref:Uncharacterized protein n=1 Tax=Anguilla anguilla TaxID=7936 RepID=A0A0E9UPM3_ANGAN